ncbi:PH domain-containing protein [Actinomadura rifamycini]|uniref:PH domain-containing protein n=1 Tax=Actinomadura rifamycini TaxID=31962 RepID=UPI000425DB42|nr:PH domain-containing protein [Actinomadura rifamycini]
MTGGTGPEPGTLTLRPPRHRVERRAVAWWMLQSLVLTGPLLAGAVTAYALWTSARPWLAVLIAGAAALLLAGVLVEPLWRYRVHRWETTDDAVYALTGWLVREWRVAPLSRVQTVDAVQGPLEQLLGLSTLRVTTASSRGAVDIGGLDRETAARTAERLSRIAQATPGDAT